MLTRGFLTGRLDFKYKTPLSKAREDYILNVIEKEDFLAVKHARALFDALIASSPKTKPDALNMAFESFSDYQEFALPYLTKNRSIDKKLESKEALIAIRNRLHAAKLARSAAATAELEQ